jgi:hypothetical protein
VPRPPPGGLAVRGGSEFGGGARRLRCAGALPRPRRAIADRGSGGARAQGGGALSECCPFRPSPAAAHTRRAIADVEFGGRGAELPPSGLAGARGAAAGREAELSCAEALGRRRRGRARGLRRRLREHIKRNAGAAERAPAQPPKTREKNFSCLH